MEKQVWNYCSNCTRSTKHRIIHSKSVDDWEEINNYQIVECCGCENTSFRLEIIHLWDSEEDENGDDINRTSSLNYPNRLHGHSNLKGSYFIPQKIRDVYNQTIMAFQGNSFLLTGVGFRAVIEAICIQEQIKGGNLEQKINNLSKNRLITEKEAERLHSIRFLGNDSVHEMEIPKETTLFMVLEIIENLLKNLYIIDHLAKSVLDTIIKNYDEFESLLWKCSEKILETEEKTLKEILGKHIRRLNIELPPLEKVVIEGINNGSVKFLKLGSVKIAEGDSISRQHYMYTGLKQDEFPF